MRENPFKSKAQARLFFAKEARGELAPGTAKRWMEETPDFASLPEYVGDNPEEDEDELLIHLVYFEGPQYWNKGRLVEVYSFYEANQQLEAWGDEGRVGFAVYILGELVYDGAYDLAMRPADLRRQMVLYLEQLGTEDAERLLVLLVQQNPEKGFIDPVTGAWRPASQFEVQLYEPGEEYDPEDEEIPESVVSETITEDEPTVEAINRALLSGTLGIGTSGLVTETREEPVRGPRPPAARIPHTIEREQQRRPLPGRRAGRRDMLPDEETRFSEQFDWLTANYGPPHGPSADWITTAWQVGRLGGEGDRMLYVVDEEDSDDENQPLYSVVARRWDDEADQWNDEILLIGTFEEVRDTTSPCQVCGRILAGETCCPPDAPDQPTGIEVLGAGGRLPVTELTERFGEMRPLPWNPAATGWYTSTGWYFGGSRWIVYRRQEEDGTPIYAVVEWDGRQVETLFTGRVDEVIPWLENLTEERRGAGARRISNNIDAEQTYIVDGEIDADGFEQWVNDAVGFFNERDVRANTDDFPTDPTVKVQYVGLTTAVASGRVVYRLHGKWRIEERAAIFKHRMASSSFINRFRLWSAGEADKGQRVQLFHYSGRPGSIRDVVICTWLASVDNDYDVNIVGFRMINGDNGIEIHQGQVEVPQTWSWNRGHRTVRKIMDDATVRVLLVDNGWPEEYYLNIGYADNPFVYF